MNRRRPRILAALAILVVVVAAACSKSDKMAFAEAAPEAPPPPPPPPPGVAMALEEAPMKEVAANGVMAKVGAVGRGGGMASGMGDFKKKMKAADREAMDKPVEAKVPEPGPASQAAPTRAWFPETFLFAPKIVTDDSGSADVDVLIPDRLTTWRVLALAHSRKGAQAGALTTMASQLPVSLDVVVPHFLVAGDRVALPLQVTNTGDKTLVEALTAKVDAGDAAGARLSGVPANIKVDASSTASAVAWLDTPAPGDVVVQADAGADDSVRRTISVKSPGLPLHTEKSGTLAAKRAFTIALPSPSGPPLPGTARATLQVFPGALAILRAELAAAPDRAGVADDAYLLSLVGNAKALSSRLGAPVDEKTIAHLSRLAGQRLARYALNPDLFAAMALAPGALAGLDAKSDEASRTLVERNGAHLVEFVARMQRPDGTFGGGQGFSLPRLIAATADGVRAVRAGEKLDDEGRRRAAAASLRARGAFERFQGQIDDPYTAAVVVASGVVEGELKEKLREKVRAAIVQRDDGARALPVPPVAQRADGAPPTEVEATALAVLALHDDEKATSLLPDLGATVLAAYRPGAGFGDGATNRAALDAVALLFAEPLPSKVTVMLTVDGKQIGSDTLEGARLHEVMTLDGLVPSLASLPVQVEADPPLPGLSYVLAVDYAVQWPKPAADAGLSLDVKVNGKLVVGSPVDVELRAVAPGGAPLHVVQGLPAGVDPVRSTLQALVSSGVISKFDVTDGVVTIDAPARHQGQLLEVRYKAVPTLAGALQARVASVALSSRPGAPVYFPPSTWTIAR